jgi:molybdopterin molybdotransferase
VGHALTHPDEARRRVLARVAALEAEDVALDRALGRILAAEVRAPEDVPGFDNSAMDGYAVIAADTAPAAPGSPVRLRVVDESRAGRPARLSLAAGEAIRISTGAMVPAGADAVVRVEDTAPAGDDVEVAVEVEAGRNVRRAGEDIRAGAAVLEPGVALGPAELGVLASVGVVRATCARRPRVAVLTTGDELRAPGEPLEPGTIRDTNSHAVPAQARRAGGDVALVQTVPDSYEATLAAIRRGLGHDVLVVCGGVSVGAHDHVRPALSEAGVEQELWGVALKPGKPFWFGARERTLVFGLPGNPVSAMVTFALFARPALLALAGADPSRTRVTATLDADVAKRPGRAHAVRCRLAARDDGWHLRPTGAQGSHVLTSMLGADALALLDVDRGDVRAGERVEAELL